MTTANHLTAGFYSTAVDTFYVTPAGRVWLVASEDDLPAVREMTTDDLAGAEPTSDLVDVTEAIHYCRQIQDASGEVLLTEDE